MLEFHASVWVLFVLVVDVFFVCVIHEWFMFRMSFIERCMHKPLSMYLLKCLNESTESDIVQVAAAVRATGDYPERLGEPPCQV